MAFLLVVVSVVVAIHLYLWHRLVRATTRPGRVRTGLTLTVAGLFLLVLGTFGGMRLESLSWLSWPGYAWVGIMFYLLVFLLVLEVPRAVAGLIMRRRAEVKEPASVVVASAPEVSEPVSVVVASVPEVDGSAASVPARTPDVPVDASPSGGVSPSVGAPSPVGAPSQGGDMSRRLFLGRVTAAVAGASALGTVGYGVTVALGDPVIEPVKVTLPGMDSRLGGLRFAVVSDIHLGPLTGRAHTERIVRMINGLEADVVAIVGDLVDGSVERLGALARPLRGLESRYGSYFVTGNHEYYTVNGPGEWIEELGELGVRSLRNERVEIRHQGAVLDLAGVNDLNGAATGDGPDFAAALGGRAERRTTVLLAHQPVQAVQAARHGVDLQLSGHTHGGQMVPFNLVIPVQQPVVSGLGTVDGVQVYVTRGAGFWGPPIRVGAPPEITMLELR
ncbi:metallophosphoesterase [Nonomuraea glycinis]|uniref:Membrane protein n=1 Tax=Nonomuraea glycinis TaxID=2047744 RepID=A0A918E4E5_9ACTN|nr:metallophosphoesterase [Nonomuraea glycinis]MCA2176661.1 metallophosphoesterase [Nonomuraea glycinis]GGP03570.1 membrane protein [Nonomuraea glycinis]